MRNQFSKNIQNIILLFVVIYSSIFFPTPAFSQDDVRIEFKNRDQLVKSLSLSDLASITTAHSLKIFEIHTQTNQIYRAYPARSIFDQTFGKKWETEEEIVFLALDGYQTSIPVTKFLSHDAYFAFAHEDNSPFTITNKLQNNEVVPLGPLYLIWDNMKSKVLLKEGASDMPYQIKSIQLTTFAARFPKLFPPAKSSAEVQRGFFHFRKYCMSCHSINGEGGGKAPELNYPTSVVEYIRPAYLARWITDPSGIRQNTLMPALAQEIPDRVQVSNEIILYLKAMSLNKQHPGKQNLR